MKVQFTVASCEAQHVMREVDIDGVKANVPIPGVVAQLLPVKEDGTGTIKVAVAPDFINLFKVGATIVVEFSEVSPTNAEASS